MKTRILADGWKLKGIEPFDRLSASTVAEVHSEDWIETGPMPAMVHDILVTRGEIREPWRAGEAEACRWVAEKDWIYACRFDLGDDVGGVDDEAVLLFKGLDTIVDIYLNGSMVASGCSMYEPLQIEVTGKLKEQNVLLLHFHTVFRDEDGGKVPIREFDGRLVRRSAQNYGTYLGPHPLFSRVGIFDDVVLETIGGGRLDEVVVGSRLSQDLGRGEVTVDISGRLREKDGTLRVRLLGPDETEVSVVTVPCGNPATDGRFNETVILSVEEPELWWPRGYGAQPLYRVEVTLLLHDGSAGDDAAGSGTGDDAANGTIHSITKQIGFRRITMPEPLHFTVNDVPVKLWGGDWVTPRWDTAVWDSPRVAALFDMAENANFNCFRVWGPVESPRDEFYELADRRGFLVWQDFTDLPLQPNERSRDVCRAEAERFVKRLKHHPSILLWCGGNEAAMWNDAAFGGKGGEWPGRLPAERDVQPVVARLDPERFYMPSTPDYGIDPNDPQVFNTHGYTNVWYVPGYDYLNFAAEDTRIAAPPLKCLKRFMASEHLWPEGYSPVWSHGDQYPWPEEWMHYSGSLSEKKTGPVELFYDAANAAELVYRLGMAESHYYIDTIERQRRGRAADDPSSRRRCGGYIVWKFNDSWPEIYSAKVDYFLEPYIPYYAVRRAYSPVLVSIEAGTYIWVWIVNDGIDRVEGDLTVRLFHMDRNEDTSEILRSVCVAPGTSQMIVRLDRAGIGTFRREHVVFAELTDPAGRVLSQADALMDIERRLTFPDARLSVSVDGSDLVITTDKFARSVVLEGDTGSHENDDDGTFGWMFEDNYFNLLPGEVKRVRVLGRHAKGRITAKAWYSPHVTEVAWDSGATGGIRR